MDNETAIISSEVEKPTKPSFSLKWRFTKQSQNQLLTLVMAMSTNWFRLMVCPQNAPIFTNFVGHSLD